MPRDPAAYREHIAQIPKEHGALTQHWLKEALQSQKSKELWEKLEEKKRTDNLEGFEETMRELEDILMK